MTIMGTHRHERSLTLVKLEDSNLGLLRCEEREACISPRDMANEKDVGPDCLRGFIERVEDPAVLSQHRGIRQGDATGMSPSGPGVAVSLHRQPEVSHEVVEETLLILQENLRDFILELDVPVSRWLFSGPDLFQEV